MKHNGMVVLRPVPSRTVVANGGIQGEVPKNKQPGTSQKNQHRVAILKKFDDLKCNRIQRLDTALWIPRLQHRRHRSRSIADLWKEIKFEPAAVEQKLLRHWALAKPHTRQILVSNCCLSHVATNIQEYCQVTPHL